MEQINVSAADKYRKFCYWLPKIGHSIHDHLCDIFLETFIKCSFSTYQLNVSYCYPIVATFVCITTISSYWFARLCNAFYSFSKRILYKYQYLYKHTGKKLHYILVERLTFEIGSLDISSSLLIWTSAKETYIC